MEPTWSMTCLFLMGLPHQAALIGVLLWATIVVKDRPRVGWRVILGVLTWFGSTSLYLLLHLGQFGGVLPHLELLMWLVMFVAPVGTLVGWCIVLSTLFLPADEWGRHEIADAADSETGR